VRVIRIANEAHRLAWGREAHLHFWTDGHPLYVATQLVDQKGIALVSPIIAHGLAE